ncbi:MAG: hypothetical protein KGM47_04540, partial [Acidobacteriota bacterium]|nr:hypothetical protein [Acidobacteriota bacterium]
QSQREREEDTIFRAQQYSRAIYLFHRRMGRYPVSVQDLLKTDNVRFLRKAYRDPLSPTGRWRFIHAAAGGILIDSWNQTSLLSPHASRLDQAPNQGTNGSFASKAAPFGGEETPATTNASATGGKPKHPPSTCTASEDSGGGSSTQTGTLLGSFIAGVAPCSDKQSIRVLNNRNHYDHWEFLGLSYSPYRLPEASGPSASHPFQPTPASQMGIQNQPGQQGAQGFDMNNGQSEPSSPQAPPPQAQPDAPQ